MVTGRKRTLDHDQIIRLHAEGLKDKEVAERIGCSISSVSNILSRWRKAQRMKAGQFDTVDEGKIWALAFGGWTLTSIAEEVGCPVEQAAEVIRKRLPK